MGELSGKRVAFLVSDGFEESELKKPLDAVKKAGGEAVVVTPDGEAAKAWASGDWGSEHRADKALKDAKPTDYAALVLPGGVINPDSLRTNDDAVRFVKSFVDKGAPVAAICHGPWTLIDAKGVKGKKMTSWPSLRADLENAGATWVDQEVVVDGNLITSRNPDDLPAFCDALVKAARG